MLSPEQQEVQVMAQQWLRLANGETFDRTEPIFKFVALWVGFNAIYWSRKPIGGDLAGALAYCDGAKVKALHASLLKDNESYGQAIATMKRKGVRRMKDGQQVNVDDERSLSSVITCVYAVRCNLFHGGKSPGDRRDGDLIEASFLVLSALLKPEMA